MISRENTTAQLGPWRNGPGSSLSRDWSARNKRGSRQGFVPHLRDRSFVGIGWPLGIFQASRPSFCPSFYLLGPPSPHPVYDAGPLFLFARLWDALGLWPHVVRPRSLSLFSCSSSSLLLSLVAFLFLLETAVSSFFSDTSLLSSFMAKRCNSAFYACILCRRGLLVIDSNYQKKNVLYVSAYDRNETFL